MSNDMYWDFEEKPTYYGFISDPITNFAIRNPVLAKVRFEDHPSKVFLYDFRYIEPVGGIEDNSPMDFLDMYLSYWTDYERSPSYHIVDENHFDESHFRWISKDIAVGNEITRSFSYNFVKKQLNKKICIKLFENAQIDNLGRRLYKVIDNERLTTRIAKSAFYNVFAYPRMTPMEFIEKWNL